MQNSSTVSLEISPRVSEFNRFRRVFFGRPVVIVGFVIIFLLIVVAIFAPFIAPYDPYEGDLKVTLNNPSASHLLGTDSLGRDILSRVIYGSRTSLEVGIISVSVSTIIGIVLGLLAGYLGGWVDAILMRIIDTLMSIPGLMLPLVFAALLGGGLINIMIAIGIVMVPAYCRLMRGQVISVKQSDYINVARSLGSSDLRIMLTHILPNCLSPLIVLITLNLGTAILTEAGLSFLGIGIRPPGAAWGGMVSDGYPYLIKHPVFSFAPGFSIMIVVLAFNMIGDGLRDALDPRLRGTI